MEDLFVRILSHDDVFFGYEGDDDNIQLTDGNKHDILQKLFDTNKMLFLQRYNNYMTDSDCTLFTNTGDSMVDFFLAQISKRKEKMKEPAEVQPKKEMKEDRQVRNRRFMAMERLKKEGDFFSDEKMREREPYLYDQMVGRFLSEEERIELRPTVSSGGWSGIISQFETSMDTAERRKWKNEEWDHESRAVNEQRTRLMAHVNRVMEMDGEVEERGTLDELRDEMDHIAFQMDEERDLNEEEEDEDTAVDILRQEFVALMEQRFIAGLESRFFDYDAIDHDERLEDADDIRARDQEEKWFDED